MITFERRTVKISALTMLLTPLFCLAAVAGERAPREVEVKKATKAFLALIDGGNTQRVGKRARR